MLPERTSILMFHKEFNVDGLDYVLTICEAGDVSLALIGGNSRKGSVYKNNILDLWPDEPIYQDVNLAPNVFSIFGKVKAIVLEYIYRVKPWRISFYATTYRKIAVYRRIASRVAKNLHGYNLVEAPEGTFSLYKLMAKVA
jgi:hypothetical protein